MSRIGARGGMSLTTGFDVIFDNLNSQIKKYHKDGKEEVVHMLCDEAQLPNVQSATAQLTGRYLGETAMQYPHARMFTDVSLGFLCDAELLPLKFFNHWYEFIFTEYQTTHDNNFDKARDTQPKLVNRINRLKYLDDYACTLKIIKTEPSHDRANGRAPISYMLENAYPYAIDAVPLAYGSSQLTRVNVNFYYSRHTVSYGDGGYESQRSMIQDAQESTGNAVLANANSNIA